MSEKIDNIPELNPSNFSTESEVSSLPEKESVSEGAEKQEIRQFTKEYSPWARKKLADLIKIARLSDRLKNPDIEEKNKKIAKLQEDFYQRFQKQKEEFESSLESREVSNIAKKYGVIFVHTIPTKNINRWNTYMNNQEINVHELSTEDLIKKIEERSPDLSCSSVSFKRRYSPNDVDKKVGTMYPFGVVLKKGTILSAYRYDAGSLTEKGVAHKKSKYDPKTQDTSIQPEGAEKIDEVLNRKYDRYLNPESGYYDGYINQKTGEISSQKPKGTEGYRGEMTGIDFDEFIISKPVIDGLFIDLDNPTLADSWYRGERLEPINNLVQKFPNTPVYIKQDNEIKIYCYREDGSVEIVDDLDAFKNLKSIGNH